jgi:hypothetical protein
MAPRPAPPCAAPPLPAPPSTKVHALLGKGASVLDASFGPAYREEVTRAGGLLADWWVPSGAEGPGGWPRARTARAPHMHACVRPPPQAEASSRQRRLGTGVRHSRAHRCQATRRQAADAGALAARPPRSPPNRYTDAAVVVPPGIPFLQSNPAAAAVRPISFYSASRPLLEGAARRLLAGNPKATIRYGEAAAGLVFDGPPPASFDATPAAGGGGSGGGGAAPLHGARPWQRRPRGAVRGVRLAGGEALEADLVVDATGRASRAPEWLAAGGWAPAPVRSVDAGVGYFSRWAGAEEGLPLGWRRAAAGRLAAGLHSLRGAAGLREGWGRAARRARPGLSPHAPAKAPSAPRVALHLLPRAPGWPAATSAAACIGRPTHRPSGPTPPLPPPRPTGNPTAAPTGSTGCHPRRRPPSRAAASAWPSA